MAASEGVVLKLKKASERSVACYIKKLFDLSMVVREYDSFFCFPARVDRAAHMNAEPVPAMNTKDAQPNLQWPSL